LLNFKMKKKNEEEKAMKRLMKIFEDIMIAVAFAEAGIPVLILQQNNGLKQKVECSHGA
jgi:hypothetical protein